MRNVIFLIIFFILFIGTSCSDSNNTKIEKDKLSSFLNTYISDSIRISDCEKQWSIHGSSTESFIVHLSRGEFLRIFNQIKPQKIAVIDDNVYGYSISKDNKLISVIFDYKDFSIKYSSSFGG